MKQIARKKCNGRDGCADCEAEAAEFGMPGAFF